MTDSKSLSLYAESIIIDALNVSNWDSPAVYEDLRAGGVTTINATVAVWENFRETLDHIAGWTRRFAARLSYQACNDETCLPPRTLPVPFDADSAGKKEGCEKDYPNDAMVTPGPPAFGSASWNVVA